MTDTSDLEAMAASFADADLAFSDPEGAAARATAEPMPMYVERAARCPVEHLRDDFVVLLRMDDIRYVNKHHDVEQASKYLGSSRPAHELLEKAAHLLQKENESEYGCAQQSAGSDLEKNRASDQTHVLPGK